MSPTTATSADNQQSDESTRRYNTARERWRDTHMPGEIFFMEMDLGGDNNERSTQPVRQLTVAEQLTAMVVEQEPPVNWRTDTQ